MHSLPHFTAIAQFVSAAGFIVAAFAVRWRLRGATTARSYILPIALAVLGLAFAVMGLDKLGVFDAFG